MEIKKLLLLVNLIFISFLSFGQSSPGIQWQKSLGGTEDEQAQSIQQTSDGGYIASGYSGSNDGDVSGNHANADCWITKLNSNGTIQWQKSLGGSIYEVGSSIRQTTDGGYIVSGYTNSNDGDVSGFHGPGAGLLDFWVIKLDATGNIQWQKCLGGTEDDFAQSIHQTADGGYIVAG